MAKNYWKSITTKLENNEFANPAMMTNAARKAHEKALRQKTTQGVTPPVEDQEPVLADISEEGEHAQIHRLNEVTDMHNPRMSYFLDKVTQKTIGTAHYLHNPRHAKAQNIVSGQVAYKTRTIFASTPLEKRAISFGLDVPWELYDTPKDALAESCTRLRGYVTFEEGEQIAFILSRLLEKPITLTVEKSSRDAGETAPALRADTYRFHLKNLSLKEIVGLGEVQLLAGNKIAQSIAGTESALSL